MEKIFDKIAPYYDILMQNIDYKGWAQYFIKICELFNVYPKKILDIACGTGSEILYLSEMGFNITGIDISEKMLEIAKEKLKDRKNVRFFKMDMRDLNLYEKYDAVFSFFDSMNYILNIDDMEKCFKGVYNVLKDGGIFIFDMNTYYSLKEIWDNSTTIKETGNIYSIWKNEWNEEERISTLKLLLNVKEKDKSFLIEEIHKERAYFPDEIENLLKKVFFKKVYFFDFKTFSEINETTIRMVVVALK
ncbi:MAG: class I SAM-dependent methyltransferase [candidate division WOR-3 bacterium]